jgi:radical SAM superfamily enzyme YgiQ (UPF0313 family)
MRRLYQNVPSVHAAYLAAILKNAGHDVVFTRGRPAGGDLALLLTSIVDYRAEMQWADGARRQGMRVGLFGAMATHAPDKVGAHADFVIMGEPEDAVLRLAAGEQLDGIVKSQPVADLDRLPFPAWYLLSEGRRRSTVGRSLVATWSALPILSSRSCPEFCTYCPHRITAPYRSRSPENVVAELERLCAEYREPQIIFRDPLFTEETERSIAIAEAIIRKKLPITFECETRLDHLDTDLIDLFYRAGLRTITFGVESVSPLTLKHVARRPIPPAHQKAIVSHCRKLGIATHGFYVFGFLDDTAESVRATIDYSIELDTTMALYKVLTPYPGTPIRKQLAPLITETDVEKFDGYTLTFKHPHLNSADIRFLLGSAYARFYIRPSWIWNYLGLANRPWIRRADEYAFRHQAEQEIAFLASQEPK